MRGFKKWKGQKPSPSLQPSSSKLISFVFGNFMVALNSPQGTSSYYKDEACSLFLLNTENNATK